MYSPWGRQRGELVLYACILVVMVFSSSALYYEALSYELSAFDSWEYIARNKCVHEINFKNIVCIVSEPYFRNWQPVTLLTYLVEFSFFRFDGYGYHATNIVLHGINSFLVFLLIMKFVWGKSTVHREVPKAYVLASSLGASALFLVHPQHVESAVWVAERKGLLAFMFLSLSLLNYYRLKSESNDKFSTILYVMFYFFAAMSKATAIMFPVLLVLLDRLYFDRTLFLKKGLVYEFFSVLISLKNKLLIITFSLLVVYANYLAQDNAVVSFEEIGVGQRVLSVLHNVFFYLSKMINPSHLHPYYLAPAAIVEQNILSFIFYGLFFIIISSVVAIAAIRCSTGLLLIWLSYLALSVTTIGIMQVGSQIAADRYAYLTTAPFYFLFSKIFASLLQFRWQVVSVLFLSLLIAFSIRSKAQILIWKDEVTIWNSVIEHSYPDRNVRAEYALGGVYALLGNTEKALMYYRRATTATDYVMFDGVVSFARLLIKEGEFSEAEFLLLKYVYSGARSYSEVEECWGLLQKVYDGMGEQDSKDRVRVLIKKILDDFKK